MISIFGLYTYVYSDINIKFYYLCFVDNSLYINEFTESGLRNVRNKEKNNLN